MPAGFPPAEPPAIAPRSPKTTAWFQRRKSEPAEAPVAKAEIPPALQTQVEASASSCSPISRLAERMEGGAIEAVRMALARATVCQSPLAAARQDGGDDDPFEGAQSVPEPVPDEPLERLGVVHQPAGDRSLEAPGVGVAADRQRRVTDLQQRRFIDSEQEITLGHG